MKGVSRCWENGLKIIWLAGQCWASSQDALQACTSVLSTIALSIARASVVWDIHGKL